MNPIETPDFNKLKTLFLIGIFLLWGFLEFYGNGKIFTYGYDEGVYLQTAFQHARGQRLYGELFVSQPPLLFEFFSPIIKLFGNNVFVLRSAFFVFPFMILCATGILAKDLFNVRTALLSVFFLGINFYFIEWTKQIRPDSPSLAFALLAVLTAVKYNKSGRLAWVVSSALLFAISNSFKLLELFFAFPILFLIVSVPLSDVDRQPYKKSYSTLLVHCALYAVICLIAVLGIIMNYDIQALKSQVIGFESAELFHIAWHRALRQFRAVYIGNQIGLFVLSLISLIVLFKRRLTLFSFFGVWIAAQILFHLLMSTWLWTQHLIALMPVLSILAAALVDWFLQLSHLLEKGKFRFRQFGGLEKVFFMVICLALLLFLLQNGNNYIRVMARLKKRQTGQENELLSMIRRYTKNTDIVISDIQMATFLTERFTLPDLVDTSRKRIRTGNLKESELIESVKDAKMVIFWSDRLILMDNFHEYMCSHYKQIYISSQKEIYLNKE